ncbi:MAG: BatA domain-containing protein [Verrucomicrobiota bacterium]|nr:BatA domain-containing protein [Verrucomicrobiota bacterium]
MLQLLSPLALFGLAALALPAILHLWRPPAKTVRLGTIRFFTGPAVRRLTKLRWRERLLLAARLLLLTLLVLLLAQPVWMNNPPTTAQRWALLEPGLVLNGTALQRWHELARAGFEPRLLTTGFPPASLDRTGPAQPTTDLWSLLREADAQLPAGSKLAMFSADRLASLRGERPAMRHCEVEWISVSNESKERAWIHSVELLHGDEADHRQVRAVVTLRDAVQSRNVAAVLPASVGQAALPRADRWSLEIAGGTDAGFSARLLHADAAIPPTPWVTVARMKPLSVAIVPAADRTEDAKYVEAAVHALGQTSATEMKIVRDIAVADWIFWLNDEPPSADVERDVASRGAVLLSDAEETRAAAVPVLTTINADGVDDAVSLFRRTPPHRDAGATIWTDGFGSPLLTWGGEGRAERWHFFSRFHPEWNDLPQSSALAAALRPLLLRSGDGHSPRASEDRRRADRSQSQPAEASSAPAADLRLVPPPQQVDLHQLLWMLCVALFIGERILSHRRNSPAAAAPLSAPARPEPAFAERA